MSDALLRMLLESSLRVSLLAGLVAAILFTLRVRAGGVRHAAWTAVLGAMLLMPVLPYCVAPITIPVSPPPYVVLDRKSSSPIVPTASLVTPRTSGGLLPELPSSPPPPAAEPSKDRPSVWPQALLAAYVAVLSILLARLALGWRAAARVLRTSRRIVPAEERTAFPGGAPVYESRLLAVPATVGASIILPAAWREWPDATLRAVLAHELAHVRRRDPLVALVAQINRCVFWFHPLAWWLKHALSATAEHACDDAAVSTVGDPRRYAEVLLEMAEGMRTRGGRILCQSIGLDGGALVGERIERLLRDAPLREPSRLRKAAVAAGCAAGIFAAAACRPQSVPPTPLQEPPRFTQEQARWNAESRLRGEASKLTAREQFDLDSAVKRNSDDLISLKKLLFLYWARLSPGNAVIDPKIVSTRRALILRLIEKHPDSELAGTPEARLFPAGVRSLEDPIGHARAKQLWLAHTSREDASPTILGNAASFFEAGDPMLAEEMLARARQRDPTGPWSSRLGEFYATVLLGRYVPILGSRWRNIIFTEPDRVYAESVPAKVEKSKDEVVLVSAARHLTRSGRTLRGAFDPYFLAKSWLERALVLNPSSIEARSLLVGLRLQERGWRAGLLLRDVGPASQYRIISALPEAERFELLADLARGAYLNAEGAARYDDLKDIVAASRNRSRRYAEDLLELAPRFRGHPSHGYAVFKANMILASLALRAGDREEAVRYMRKAAQAPASEELAYARGVAAWSLLGDLLKEGERESVIEFLEKMAEKNVARQDHLHESVAAIRRGEMPRFDRMGYLE